MGSITAYETTTGKRYRVRYRKPDHSQTDKRGFRTKREAELFLAATEVRKATGEFIDATASRISPALTLHDLRHVAASLASSAGANVKAVQGMLGHTSAAMTLDTVLICLTMI